MRAIHDFQCNWRKRYDTDPAKPWHEGADHGFLRFVPCRVGREAGANSFRRGTGSVNISAGKLEKPDKKLKPPHLRIAEPSDWVSRFAPLVAAGGPVLDITCGGGRHTRLFTDRGHPVVGIDKDMRHMGDLEHNDAVELIEFDLESGAPLPVAGRLFAAVVLVYYVHRPLFAECIKLLAPGGVLLCETFAHGDEIYHSPHNPDHLLANGELIDAFQGRLQIVAYEHGLVESPFRGRPGPGIVQRLCATNDRTVRADGVATAPPRKLAPSVST